MPDILYICGGRSFSSFSPGRKIGEIVKCWRDEGHIVHHVCGADILSGKRAGDVAAPSVPYGAQETFSRWYRRFPGAAPMVRTASEWRDIRHDRQMLRHLRKAHGWRSLGLVWERSSRLHSAGLEFAREIGVPYVLEWKDHLIDYESSLFRDRALKLETRKNHQADCIVVESGVLKGDLVRDGIDSGKVFVAHNAVNASEFSRNESERARIRGELGLGDDVVLAGYLGSYAFYHNASGLVRAAELIRDKHKYRKVKILMVGAGMNYPQCRQLAERLRLLNETVIMHSGVPKEEVPAILCALDIAILPGSTDIICPIKVQEYMACELPTLAPDYACNREVLEDGVTGVLFKPGSDGDLAAKIVGLAVDPDRRETMGKRAREVVAGRFSWEATWGSTLKRVLEMTPR